MRFEFFVARRYLRAKRKQAMISVITAISVAGVAAGVMALVIALAINAGFRNTLQRNLLGATAHVSILEKEPGTGIENWADLTSKLRNMPHVTTASPGLYGTAFLSGPAQGAGAILKGIDMASTQPLAETLTRLKEGSLDGLKNSGDDLPGVILGSRLAQQVGAMTGRQVQVIIPNGEITPFGPRPSFWRFRVAGIFESGFFELDSTWAFTSLAAAQKSLGLNDVVNSIELKLDDLYAAPEVARAVGPMIGPRLAALTWGEQNQQILSALRMERVVTVVTIGLIQLVAALNIVIALVMMVMEKHRDIAILISMGARVGHVRNIFMFEGVLIGAVGTVIGLIAGYTLCFLADRYRWLRLDETVYSLSFVPFEPRWWDGVWIAAAAMLVSFVATIYPARNATRIQPVESLRYE